jgi:hypothetical protein
VRFCGAKWCLTSHDYTALSRRVVKSQLHVIAGGRGGDARYLGLKAHRMNQPNDVQGGMCDA